MGRNAPHRQCIGGNLQRMRCQRGWSQQELCNELKQFDLALHRSTYAKYETGESSIPADVLVGLQRLYGCSFEAFFVGAT